MSQSYGPFTNEELVGEALAPLRAQVKIATKFGIKLHSGGQQVVDSRPERVRQSVEGPLRRLGVEAIDLYYQHRVDELTSEDLRGIDSAASKITIQGARYPEQLEKRTGL